MTFARWQRTLNKIVRAEDFPKQLSIFTESKEKENFYSRFFLNINYIWHFKSILY